MKIHSVSLFKKLLVVAISVIVSATGLTKLATTATSVEAATAAPCIIAISGIQYDVAPLTVAGIHPGGNVFVCGTDMTALFMAMPTHAADIARMTPYIYIAPTATPTPTTVPTVSPSPIPSTTPAPSITPSPIPSTTPAPSVTPTVSPAPSTTPAPSISPAPRHEEENEVEEAHEIEHVEQQEVSHTERSNHGQEVRQVARNNSHSSHREDD